MRPHLMPPPVDHSPQFENHCLMHLISRAQTAHIHTWHLSVSCRAAWSRALLVSASVSSCWRTCLSCSSLVLSSVQSDFRVLNCPLYWKTVWARVSSFSFRSRRASSSLSRSASLSSTSLLSSCRQSERKCSSSARTELSSSCKVQTCCCSSLSRSLASVSWDVAWTRQSTTLGKCVCQHQLTSVTNTIPPGMILTQSASDLLYNLNITSLLLVTFLRFFSSISCCLRRWLFSRSSCKARALCSWAKRRWVSFLSSSNYAAYHIYSLDKVKVKGVNYSVFRFNYVQQSYEKYFPLIAYLSQWMVSVFLGNKQASFKIINSGISEVSEWFIWTNHYIIYIKFWS